MTWVLVGCAMLTAVAVWTAVFAVRRWLHAMHKLVRFQQQWNVAPEICAVCGAIKETPVHVPPDMEARVPAGHRYVPARVVRQSPGLLLPVPERRRLR